MTPDNLNPETQPSERKEQPDGDSVSLGTIGLAAIEDADRIQQDETIIDAEEASRVEDFALAITTKSFIPDRDPGWILRNIASKPRGTRVLMGFIAGEAFEFRRLETPYKDKVLESVELRGDFAAMMASTGEVVAATTVYLPKRAGLILEQQLTQGWRELDLSVSLVATGDPSITYEWVFGQRRQGRSTIKDAILARQAKTLAKARALMIEGRATPAAAPLIETTPGK